MKPTTLSSYFSWDFFWIVVILGVVSVGLYMVDPRLATFFMTTVAAGLAHERRRLEEALEDRPH